MDLGIKTRKALLCASSKGLGKACALALSREGVTVWINGRNQGPLDEAAALFAMAAERALPPQYRRTQCPLRPASR